MFSYWEETGSRKLGAKRSTTMKSSLPNAERSPHPAPAEPLHLIPQRITLLAVCLGRSWQPGSGWLVHQVSHAGCKDLGGTNSDQQQPAACPGGKRNQD